MRIQHNIPALSAYRNYTNNVSSLSKNLERLSSGYKINRAGDDAAGLAISEKMRAQITGLEVAQKNAKDGISLVQTAEGALTEVHDMLNRMYELAEQSANGTYDDEVDRAQLQKEVESIKTEINRISKASNFNGIQLLDGSMDSTVTKIVNKPSFINETGTAVKDAIYDRNGNKMLTTASYLTAGSVATEDKYNYLHKDAAESAKTSFVVNLDNRQITSATCATTISFTFGLYGATVVGTDITAYEIAVTVSLDNTTPVTDTDIAKAVYDEIVKKDPDNKPYLTMTVAGFAIEYEVKLDGDKLEFTMTDKGWGTAAAATSGQITASGNPFAGNFNIAVTASGTGINTPGRTDCSTSDIKIGTGSVTERLAETRIVFATGTNTTQGGYTALAADTYIKDGAGLRIGDTYYVWAGSDETMNAEYGDNVVKVDIRDLVDKDTGLLASGKQTSASGGGFTFGYMSQALSRLSDAADNNDTFTVGYNQFSHSLMIKEKSGQTSGFDLTTCEGFQKALGTFTGIKSNVETIDATGKSLVLQIGDTPEKFNQLNVDIKAVNTDAMKLTDLDIGTQEGAIEAMGIIKDAINYVSDVRGTLGATQNRLDHTINNLSVMQENIQDAESTIRDVDVAKEMMEYTKNNILVQSAQAMLAQANQLPQGVLQLLQ